MESKLICLGSILLLKTRSAWSAIASKPAVNYFWLFDKKSPLHQYLFVMDLSNTDNHKVQSKVYMPFTKLT